MWVKYSQKWALPWRAVDRPSDAPLEKPDSSSPKSYKLWLVSCLGWVSLSTFFSFSMLGLCLACASADFVPAVAVWVPICISPGCIWNTTTYHFFVPSANSPPSLWTDLIVPILRRPQTDSKTLSMLFQTTKWADYIQRWIRNWGHLIFPNLRRSRNLGDIEETKIISKTFLELLGLAS